MIEATKDLKWERFRSPEPSSIDCIGDDEHGVASHHSFRCAECGDPYTHQFAVEVYFRHEDCESGAFLRVSQDGALPILGEGNPSKRRDGLRILLSCENCGAVSGVTFAQHKGFTHVDYEVVGKMLD